jgi:hypothetical protein
VHDTIDPQLENDLGGVRPVLRGPKNFGARRRVLDQHGLARDVELVAARLLVNAERLR